MTNDPALPRRPEEPGLEPMLPGALADEDEIPEHLLCKGMPVWLLRRRPDGSFHRLAETIFESSEPGSELAMIACTIGDTDTYLPYGLHRVRFRGPVTADPSSPVRTPSPSSASAGPPAQAGP